MDDWKKRRREKQKLLTSKPSYEEDSFNRQKERTKRISPFRNSHFYILPLDQENDQKKYTMTVEVTAKNEIFNETTDNLQSELDESLNLNYVYLETLVEINRPDDYALRGFGFLLRSGLSNTESSIPINILLNNDIISVEKRFATIVVVEPSKLK